MERKQICVWVLLAEAVIAGTILDFTHMNILEAIKENPINWGGMLVIALLAAKVISLEKKSTGANFRK